MKPDPTEIVRRLWEAKLNADPLDREQLEAKYGEVFDIDELKLRFEVQSFAAPFVIVRDRMTGQVGTLQFQHAPRFYFGWLEDKP
jgi:hypothetical protein